MLERKRVVVGDSEFESVMLALKSEQVTPLAKLDGTKGNEFLRAGCLLLEAVVGSLRTKDLPQLTCPVCQWLPKEPITNFCGHTYCRGCRPNECVLCGEPVPEYLEQTILIRKAIEKWWPYEMEASRLRERGLAFVDENQLDDALRAYNAGLRICAEDHLLLEARSDVLHKLNRLESSLEDAISAIRLRPFWSKGYYRKAVALTSLGQYEDAFVSFALCAALEQNCDRVKNEFTKLLQKLSSPSRRNPISPWWSSNYASPVESTSSGDDARMYTDTASTSYPNFENKKHQMLLERVLKEIEETKKIESSGRHMLRHYQLLDPDDFECVLCSRSLWQPVTTPCGHTYCTVCLDRSLDWGPNCPLCLSVLFQYVAGSKKMITYFMEIALSMGLPEEYNCRFLANKAEISTFGLSPEVSIFICTMAYPGVACPLYIFEPRYRLLVRRAVESGTRQFGMVSCPILPNGLSRPFSYGTLLEITDWSLLDDGCSLLSCIGLKRFKIHARNECDGYGIGQVKYFVDEPIPPHAVPEIAEHQKKVMKMCKKWFSSRSPAIKKEILTFLGHMPELEEDWYTMESGPTWAWWLVSVLPLGKSLQGTILKTTCYAKRLKAIEKSLKCIEQGSDWLQRGAMSGEIRQDKVGEPIPRNYNVISSSPNDPSICIIQDKTVY